MSQAWLQWLQDVPVDSFLYEKSVPPVQKRYMVRRRAMPWFESFSTHPNIVVEDAANVAHLPKISGFVSYCNLYMSEARHRECSCHDV
eukprot:2814919-Prymnesium_polylepis.1